MSHTIGATQLSDHHQQARRVKCLAQGYNKTERGFEQATRWLQDEPYHQCYGCPRKQSNPKNAMFCWGLPVYTEIEAPPVCFKQISHTSIQTAREVWLNIEKYAENILLNPENKSTHFPTW
ncbi:hypothetical protein AMECASPLE_017535 [Ameca splendens]|uniref:Uncharacterized protein n=1 Tax=Ameca splendens TaxID=208324 RepID=A0ABV0XRC9_9TELE